MNKRFSITVSGVVQGVFFRASTKAKADELGIKGFVSNQRDGSVYIEAEGESERLKKFIQWCRNGPANASVERCDVREMEFSGDQHFVIQR